MPIGPYRFEFEVIEGWEKLPEGWSFVEVAGVAVDSHDRVYVFNRGQHPVIIFDKEGKFLNAWGEGIFTSPHGIFIGRDDTVYLTDDGDHTIRLFDYAGNMKMIIGQPGVSAETGYKHGVSPVLFGGKPFNRVTNVATGRNGDLYISDGYGNARVHRFSADGKHMTSWGQPGRRPGEFNLPHGIAVDSAGRVYVADRENSRIQIFNQDGMFIQSWDWLNRPSDIFIDDQDMIHVAELGWSKPSGAHVHYDYMQSPPCGHDPIARVTVCDPDGKIVSRIGGFNPILPGNFCAPHGLWCDGHGDLYVGEVILKGGAVRHFAPLTPHAFQKFKRSG
jgi:streptogramin lyase